MVEPRVLEEITIKKLFLSLILGILLLSVVSAGIINEYTPLEKYGKVELSSHLWIDVFGWFDSKVQDITLEKNSDSCGTDCYAELPITLYKEGALVDSIRFNRILKHETINEDAPINYKFLIRTGYEDVNDYEQVCVDGKEVLGNETYEQVCEDKVIETHKSPVYEDYEEGKKVPAGDYVLRLEGNKIANHKIDWIITSQGKEIIEWAVWDGVTSFIENYTNDVIGSGGGTVTPKTGMKIKTNTDGIILGVFLTSSALATPPTKCYVLDSGKSTLATGTFAGLNCNFSAPYSFTGGTVYYLMVDKEGAGYTQRYKTVTLTVSNNYINWTHGVNEVPGESTTEAMMIWGALLGGATLPTYPNITSTQSYPEESFKTNLNTINFGCNFTANNGTYYTNQRIRNVTINVYNSSNYLSYTNTETGLDTVSYNKSWTSGALTDDTYHWNCGANGVYWSEDTSLRVIAVDYTGQNNGTAIGGVKFGSEYAKLGDGGANFNGINNNYITTMYNKSTKLNLTLSFWFKWNLGLSQGEPQYPNVLRIGKNYASNATSFFIYTNTSNSNYGKLVFKIYNTTGGSIERSSTIRLNDSLYHHFVGTINDTAINFYVDSVVMGHVLLITGLNINEGNLSIGGYGNGQSINGSIDEPMIFNRSLSSTEISALYTNQSTGYKAFQNDANLVAYYDMDSDNVINNNTETTNRTFSIETVKPTISIYSPSGTYSYLSSVSSIILNYTASDEYLESCWYNSTFNTTINYQPFCNITEYLNVANYGTNTIYVYANDTYGNQHINFTTFNSYIFENSRNHSTTTTQTLTERISINITAPISVGSALLSFGGTNYSTTKTGDTFYTDVLIPEISGNISIYWALNDGGTIYNTYTSYMWINNLSNIIINTSCSDRAYRFITYDEETLVPILGNFSYNIYYGLTNGSNKHIFGNVTSVNSIDLCINSTASPTWVISQGEIFYTSGGYSDRRYYIFDNTSINNNTNNISLYSILTSSQTSFKLVAQTLSLIPYQNVFTALVRWYPGLDSYKIVDMGTTDETGSTVMHLKTEDVDYRIGIYERTGKLLKLTDAVRMVCLALPCTYNVFVDSSTTEYQSYFNIDNSLTYNNNTKMISYIWSDASGRTQSMELKVFKETGTTQQTICLVQANASVGALSCNLTGQTGLIKATAYRTASPATIVASWVGEIRTRITDFASGKALGLLMSFILVILVGLIGIFSPIAALIMAILALIPALFMGAINLAVAIGVGILAFIVYHAIKKS